MLEGEPGAGFRVVRTARLEDVARPVGRPVDAVAPRPRRVVVWRPMSGEHKHAKRIVPVQVRVQRASSVAGRLPPATPRQDRSLALAPRGARPDAPHRRAARMSAVLAPAVMKDRRDEREFFSGMLRGE